MELTPEERIAELEALLSTMADLLALVHARGLAMQELLSERGLLPRDDVLTRMNAMQAESDTAVEFSSQYEAFRRWRREREAGGPAPDDVEGR